MYICSMPRQVFKATKLMTFSIKMGSPWLIVLLSLMLPAFTLALAQEYDFTIKEADYTRLCSSKKILTVNGQFPGPTIHLHKGDTVIVHVTNKASHNITIHWHGVRQPRNPWSDGPAYITQCPIRPGSSFTQTVIFSAEEGTLWWHAHSDWSRATVYGAIVIYPQRGKRYPFPKPHMDIPVLLGEWWKADVNDVLKEALQTGLEPNVSDAFTINGQPGDLYQCSQQDTFKLQVVHGKTYLLRVINADMNTNLFFAIAGHKLTLVGTDASYTKPYTTDYIMISPGETMDLLLHANVVDPDHGYRYYMATRAYSTGVRIAFDNTTSTAVLEYCNKANSSSTRSVPLFPALPAFNDTDAATNFIRGLRSLASEDHPVQVPLVVDKRIFITISVNRLRCSRTDGCLGPNNTRLSASLNNISFITPTIDVLRAYYTGIGGVFNDDFPTSPQVRFNFTADNIPSKYITPRTGTEVRVLEFNKTIEVVFQGTNLLGGVNHPMHLHGYSFYVVGFGFGNFDRNVDPNRYNLVDPPEKNVAGVPKNGWMAVRFVSNNPGVWFMHCHLERHLVWGMDTAFIVKNGVGPNATILPPPKDLPRC